MLNNVIQDIKKFEREKSNQDDTLTPEEREALEILKNT